MFKVQIGEEDADENGLIKGLSLPLKHKTRLGVLRLFNRLQKKLAEHEKDPEEFSVWPVSIVMPCRRAYIYKGPDDFPLDNVACRCKNPKHRPVLWKEKPDKDLGEME